MARGGFFRRIGRAVSRIVERVTRPDQGPDYTKPPPKRRRRRRVLPPPDEGEGGAGGGGPILDLGPDWTGEWLDIDLALIGEVVDDLMADMDAGGYF